MATRPQPAATAISTSDFSFIAKSPGIVGRSPSRDLNRNEPGAGHPGAPNLINPFIGNGGVKASAYTVRNDWIDRRGYSGLGTLTAVRRCNRRSQSASGRLGRKDRK